MRLDLLTELNGERTARRSALVVTDLETGAQRLVRGDGVTQDPLADPLGKILRKGRSSPVEHDGRSYFVLAAVPPVRLMVIGAVHVSQALAPMAKLAGLDMTIIDPRTAFASPERFPECRVMAVWPDVALADIGLDRFTALATLTHDPKIDDLGLAAALQHDCFYVGALGSRKTHANRCGRLAALGFDQDALDRIHAPIGLDIGAVSPAEIAVSILGEVILALRRKPTRAEKASSASPT